MKILYGIQLNGNGHITRSSEIIKCLISKGHEIEVITSGRNSDLEIDSIKNYKGFSLIYNKKGSVDWIKTFTKSNIFRLFYDILKIDINKYDLVISDFEPVSAWSSILRNKKSIGISNQYTLLKENSIKGYFLSKYFIKIFAPCKNYINIDYLKTENTIQPIIRKEITNGLNKNMKHYVVYLPSIDPSFIIQELSKVNNEIWYLYTNKNIINNSHNVMVKKIDKEGFIQDILSCKGVITASGFSTTSEVLFLNKKLWSIPLKGQYEQIRNSEKLKELGKFTEEFNKINAKKWLEFAENLNFKWFDPIDEIIYEINRIYEKN